MQEDHLAEFNSRNKHRNKIIQFSTGGNKNFVYKTDFFLNYIFFGSLVYMHLSMCKIKKTINFETYQNPC